MKKLLPHVIPLLTQNRLTELTFFTTNRCNMACKHCFVVDELNTKMEHLSLEEIQRMSPHISHMQRVHLGGGEPFTRKDILEIALTATNDWKAGVVCIPTNGWFGDRIIDFIEQYGPNAQGLLRLHFSINSRDPQSMDSFTQKKGTFERWKKNILAAKEASKHFDNIMIVALATYNEYNQHEFRDLMNYVTDELEVDDFSFHVVREHGNYSPTLDLAQYRSIVREYFEKRSKQNPFLRAYRQIIREGSAEYFENPCFQSACSSAKLRAVMAPNGDVYPCERLGYPNGNDKAYWLLGNIRDFDYNIHELMKSERAKQRHHQIVSEQCHCQHNIDRALSMLSKPKFQAQVLKKSAKNFIHDRLR